MATNVAGVNGTTFQPDHTVIRISVLTAYALTYPAALLGNIAVIHVIFCHVGMRTVTNYLIVNMSVANLLVTFVAMPYSVSLLYVTTWFPGVFGMVLCKTVHYSYALPIAASILALLLSSLDRYYAVVRPLERTPLFLRRVPCTTTLIWLTSVVVMSPYLVFMRVVNVQGVWLCARDLGSYGIDTIQASQYYFIFLFVFLYTLPLLVIAVTFFLIGRKLWLRRIPGQQTSASARSLERSKRKVVRMFIILISTFAFSWIPAHVMHFMMMFDRALFAAVARPVQLLSFWFCHLYSAISPFLFIGFNDKFRAGFRKIFGCASGTHRRNGNHLSRRS